MERFAEIQGDSFFFLCKNNKRRNKNDNSMKDRKNHTKQIQISK